MVLAVMEDGFQLSVSEILENLRSLSKLLLLNRKRLKIFGPTVFETDLTFKRRSELSRADRSLTDVLFPRLDYSFS